MADFETFEILPLGQGAQFESSRGPGSGPGKSGPVVLPTLTLRDQPFVVLKNFAFNDPAMPARFAPIIARIARLVVASQVSGEPIHSMGAGQSGPARTEARIKALSAKYARLDAAALQRQAQANLLRAQCMP